MNLTPPSDRVLIRQCEPETETAFGLAIPEAAQERPLRGIVVAVGAGARDRNGAQHPLGVYAVESFTTASQWPNRGGLKVMNQSLLMPGDEVVIPKWGGTSLEYDGDEYISILASEILGVLV